MIEIITEEVEMPPCTEWKYKKDFVNNRWIVIDTHSQTVRYKGKYEDVCIASYNLNKKYYKDLKDRL